MNSHDPLDQLRAIAPDPATLEREWPVETRLAVRARVTDRIERAAARPPRFRAAPTRRRLRRVAVPLAAAAVVALMVGLLVTVLSGDDDGGLRPAGPPVTATSIDETPVVGPGQFAHRVTRTYGVENGRRVSERVDVWTASDGASWRFTNGRLPDRCLRSERIVKPTFDWATRAFVDSLPTDPDELGAFLRSRVSGSTSRDEAVFVAVGDLLRTYDLFATAEQRAAMVTVLSRTGGVAVHKDVLDSRGRTTVRADFVDPNNRPGQLESLYFDPQTYQLLEEATRTTAPTTYSSQDYDATPPDATTPDELPEPTYLVSVVSETVVDSLPDGVTRCGQN